MAFRMAPIRITGISIRPPDTAPGEKSPSKIRKRKPMRIRPAKIKRPAKRRTRR